jgi:hypothetical protein
VDRDMLMRFHFGLGVGHVYSHYRTTPAELQREGGTVHHDVQDFLDNAEVDEVDNDYGNGDGYEDDIESEDDITYESDADARSASNDSLSEESEEMYDSELELDYEN